MKFINIDEMDLRNKYCIDIYFDDSLRLDGSADFREIIQTNKDGYLADVFATIERIKQYTRNRKVRRIAITRGMFDRFTDHNLINADTRICIAMDTLCNDKVYMNEIPKEATHLVQVDGSFEIELMDLFENEDNKYPKWQTEIFAKFNGAVRIIPSRHENVVRIMEGRTFTNIRPVREWEYVDVEGFKNPLALSCSNFNNSGVYLGDVHFSDGINFRSTLVYVNENKERNVKEE